MGLFAYQHSGNYYAAMHDDNHNATVHRTFTHDGHNVLTEHNLGPGFIVAFIALVNKRNPNDDRMQFMLDTIRQYGLYFMRPIHQYC